MPGSITREQIQDGHFITMPDGTERCVRVGIDFMSGIAVNLYVRLVGDMYFYPVPMAQDIYSTDWLIVKEIGLDGGWWGQPTAAGQPTYAQLEANGALIYTSPRTGVSSPGITGISAAFADWVIINTTNACQVATNHWLEEKFLPKIQGAIDWAYENWFQPPPPQPAPPKDYPPQVKGKVVNALALCDAQGMRLQLSVDPQNPDRVLVAAGPAPT